MSNVKLSNVKMIQMSNVKPFDVPQSHTCIELFDVRHSNVECQTKNVKPNSMPFVSGLYAPQGVAMVKRVYRVR